MPVRTKTIGSRLTVGADPELFLMQHDWYTSAIDRLGGSKECPRPLGNRVGFFVQEDNVAAEFNIPPAKSAEEFTDSISYAISEITKELSDMGVKPVFVASAEFPSMELKDPRAQVFGCDPDFNAWNGGASNPKPRSKNIRLRSCGGHIHVGYPMDEPVHLLRAIQLMDLYLGVPSILMDADTTRRELYGKAGAFRKQPYGFEYRVLSNFWLAKPALHKWAYNQTVRAMEAAVKFGLPPKVGGQDAYSEFMERNDLCDDIRDCINGSNVELAQKLCAHHDLEQVY